MSEKDEAKEHYNLSDKIFFVLIIVAVLTGIADYLGASLGTWYSQNWITVTMWVVVSFIVWFIYFVMFDSFSSANFVEKILYVLTIVLVLTGIADYYHGSLGTWYTQNWVKITVGISILFVVWFFVCIAFSPSEEYDKKVELKKSIIRKKILKEKSKELESLNLTSEEKDFLINKWVDDSYYREDFTSLTTSTLTGDELESAVGRSPPLAQRDKEIMINKVGTRCCYPHCPETLALEVHHITPRAEGGTNDENNLIVLCNNHHHLADRGAIPKDRLRMYSVANLSETSNETQSHEITCGYCGTVYSTNRSRCPHCGAQRKN